MQMVKGIPVLFIQGECDRTFKQFGLNAFVAETLAGFAGGVGQG